MTDRRLSNVSASVRQRLLTLAQTRGEDFQRILTQYALERLLYRLSRSPFADRFTLKGALLFLLWMDEPHRRTKDLDLLGAGDPAPTKLAELFGTICDTPVEDDGLLFMTETITARPIREDNVYGGVRVRLTALLGTARIPVQVDVGFGDAVTPAAQQASFPTLLDFPAPQLLVYPQETTIAEKLSAIVTLDLDNSRMKDFYDLWTLGHRFAYEGPVLCAAAAATFGRRSFMLPEQSPVGLTEAFAQDARKQAQWKAFLTQSVGVDNQALSLREVIVFLAEFLLPILKAIRSGVTWESAWPPGGPWQADGESSR